MVRINKSIIEHKILTEKQLQKSVCILFTALYNDNLLNIDAVHQLVLFHVRLNENKLKYE